MTQNEIALKILNMGKDGYKDDAEGFEKLNKANKLIEEHVTEQLRLYGVSGSLPSLNEIKLEPVYGSTYCQYSVIEQKLAILYQNQEKILQAIKLVGNDR